MFPSSAEVPITSTLPANFCQTWVQGQSFFLSLLSLDRYNFQLLLGTCAKSKMYMHVMVCVWLLSDVYIALEHRGSPSLRPLHITEDPTARWPISVLATLLCYNFFWVKIFFPEVKGEAHELQEVNNTVSGSSWNEQELRSTASNRSTKLLERKKIPKQLNCL